MEKTTRAKMRKEILAKRSSLSKQQQNHASLLISKKIIRMPEFIRSKRIAFYFANNREISTHWLLQRAFTLGKDCFFPIIDPVKHNKLLFGRYQPGDQLKKNCFGILEPDLHNIMPIKPWSLDLVLTPLVGFDSKCNRLGMGGGYYDRTFNYLINSASNKPKLFGLAYDFQQLPLLLTETWDIPLDLIVTENQIVTRVNI